MDEKQIQNIIQLQSQKQVERNFRRSAIAERNIIEYGNLHQDLTNWVEERRYRRLPVAPLHELLWQEHWMVNQKKEIFCKTPQQFFVLTPKNAVETLERIFPGVPLVEIKPQITRVVELIRIFCTARRVIGDEGIHSRYKERIGEEKVALDYWEDFFLFDDNLFHQHNGLIHGKNYKERLIWEKQTVPTPREFQANIRLIKKNKNVAIAEKKTSITSRFINEAMRYLENRNYKPIQALCRKLPDENNKTKMRTKITGPGETYDSHPSVNFVKVLNELAKLKNKVPLGIQEQIAVIADGESVVVDKLAELVACCCLSIPVKPKLWIIATNDSSYILELLNMIYFLEKEQPWLPVSANPQNIFLEDNLTKIIERTYLGMQLVCLESASNLATLDEVYFRRIKKIIRRKPVAFSLSGVGKLTYHNRCQWVAFLNKETEIRRYNEFLGELAEVIYLPNLNAPFKIWEVDFAEVLWLLVVFAIYGTTRMLEKRKTNDLYDSSALIQSFLKERCVFGEVEICYKDELYEAYSFFLRTRYSMEPLPKGRFHNLISEMTKLEEKRPRTSRADHKRGYRGISVALKNAEADSPEIRKAKVISYLEAINKKVLTLLELDVAGGAEKQPNSEGG